MSRICLLLLGSFAAPAAAQQGGGGAFVVRLGQDTLAIESYTRTGNRIDGEAVVRTPTSVHRIFRATLAPDGTIQSFELITHNIGGGPGPAETRRTAEFRGDSAVVRVPARDSTVTIRLAAAKGAVPFVIHTYALVEYVAQRARAAGGTVYVTQAVALGAREPWPVTARRLAPDSFSLMIGQLGPFTAKLDGGGRLAHLSGKGSTLQVEVERVPAVDLRALGPAFANRPLGQLSGRDTARATIDGVELWVDYGRPLKRGREIFGVLEPWNKVWRTGANAATQFHTSADLAMGGQTIPAGTYTLWTIPSPSRWKLIINKQTGQWGTQYDPEQDLVRLDLEGQSCVSVVEQLTIAIEPKAGGDGGLLAIAWDCTRVWIPFTRKQP